MTRYSHLEEFASLIHTTSRNSTNQMLENLQHIQAKSWSTHDVLISLIHVATELEPNPKNRILVIHYCSRTENSARDPRGNDKITFIPGDRSPIKENEQREADPPPRRKKALSNRLIKRGRSSRRGPERDIGPLTWRELDVNVVAIRL